MKLGEHQAHRTYNIQRTNSFRHCGLRQPMRKQAPYPSKVSETAPPFRVVVQVRIVSNGAHLRPKSALPKLTAVPRCSRDYCARRFSRGWPFWAGRMSLTARRTGSLSSCLLPSSRASRVHLKSSCTVRSTVTRPPIVSDSPICAASPKFEQIDRVMLKQAYSAFATFLLEAVKTNITTEQTT